MSLDTYVHEYLLRGARGGFAAKLADAWCVADSGNRAILQTVFLNIFTVPKELQ